MAPLKEGESVSRGPSLPAYPQVSLTGACRRAGSGSGLSTGTSGTSSITDGSRELQAQGVAQAKPGALTPRKTPWGCCHLDCLCTSRNTTAVAQALRKQCQLRDSLAGHRSLLLGRCLLQLRPLSQRHQQRSTPAHLAPASMQVALWQNLASRSQESLVKLAELASSRARLPSSAQLRGQTAVPRVSHQGPTAQHQKLQQSSLGPRRAGSAACKAAPSKPPSSSTVTSPSACKRPRTTWHAERSRQTTPQVAFNAARLM